MVWVGEGWGPGPSRGRHCKERGGSGPSLCRVLTSHGHLGVRSLRKETKGVCSVVFALILQ